MDYASGRSGGCRVTRFTHRGFSCLAMENEIIRIVLLLDKGADIISFVYKPKDLEFLWRDEAGLKARPIDCAAQPVGAYFDNYPGGWQEILPGGGPMDYLGAEVGLHGEISLRPWEFHVEKDEAAEICVLLTGRTMRFPFLVRKRITLKGGDPTVYFSEALSNKGRQSLEYLWAQHPCFGPPFIEAGCRLAVPAEIFMASPGFITRNMLFEPGYRATWPLGEAEGNRVAVVQPPDSGIVGLYHFSGLEKGYFAILNDRLDVGFCMRWDKEAFPYITSWQDYNGCMDYPWYGTGYNLTMEFWNSPTDNFETSKQNGGVRQIGPGETLHTEYTAAVFEDVKMDRTARLP